MWHGIKNRFTAEQQEQWHFKNMSYGNICTRVTRGIDLFVYVFMPNYTEIPWLADTCFPHLLLHNKIHQMNKAFWARVRLQRCYEIKNSKTDISSNLITLIMPARTDSRGVVIIIYLRCINDMLENACNTYW